MQVTTYEEAFKKKLTIADIVDGFAEDTKTGKVTAYGGKLNVRPPYQREFVYEMDKQKAVIDTILKGYPLNVMYWAKNGDGYELMDGQQRTISFAKYFQDQYSVYVDMAGKTTPKTFSGLLGEDRKRFLEYPLTVYICDGDEKEKLEWFQTINIAGVKLTAQEMRNAIHNGSWVTDAKRYFSRVDGEGYASEGHTFNDHKYGDWMLIFPVPITILLLRKKDMDKRIKYGLIALAWLVYIIVFGSGGNKNNQSQIQEPAIESIQESTPETIARLEFAGQNGIVKEVLL